MLALDIFALTNPSNKGYWKDAPWTTNVMFELIISGKARELTLALVSYVKWESNND